MAALVRRVAEALFALVVLAAAMPAMAGDRALFNPIGYSADGKYFAYEEYGISDGAGLPYSSIYVIDLAADKWTYGTPFDARGSEDKPDASLADIRAEAMGRARESLGPRKVNVPAEFLALHGDGEADDGKTISWASPRCCGPADLEDDKTTLTLTTSKIAGSDDTCPPSENPVGYALTLSGKDGERVLHKDGKKLPFSRGCTLDYTLYAVVRPLEGDGPRVAVIATYPKGFEGPDRRFIVLGIDK